MSKRRDFNGQADRTSPSKQHLKYCSLKDAHTPMAIGEVRKYDLGLTSVGNNVDEDGACVILAGAIIPHSPHSTYAMMFPTEGVKPCHSTWITTVKMLNY